MLLRSRISLHPLFFAILILLSSTSTLSYSYLSILSTQAQAIESQSQREETFLDQALDYLFEAENDEVFADKEKEKDNDKKGNDKKM
jgi:type II secretory pathway component PulJ